MKGSPRSKRNNAPATSWFRIQATDSRFFHEILDIETLVRENLWKYGDDDEDEGIYTLDLYRQPHMRYYCFANNFSEACRDGEFGDVHRSVILFKIPKLVFEELRKRASSLTVIVMDEVKTSRS